ncbi:SpoIIE family protein phosphatase [Streptomyces sp. NBC_01198]|uniref:SpoIIE family protein phosphatase n=1 Tax=Streptomyces sp. NBC_01198 TaxID=2903769 RepID=UPI002E14A8CF|nr:SpoIIE family protein phosphatase [Streptomyces sp. NBC_01198]
MANSDLLMRIDDTGLVLECAPSVCAMFRRPAEDIVGRPVGPLVREAVGEEQQRGCGVVDHALVKPVLSGSSVVWEVRAARPNTISASDLAILRVMFTHSPMGLHVLDDQLRIVRANTETCRLWDSDSGSPLGRVFTEAYRFAEPEKEEAAARRVLATGEAEPDRIVRSATGGGNGKHRVYAVSYARLEDDDGEILGLVASTLDVTDRDRAFQRLKILEQVRKQVGERLDVTAVCEELAHAVVPAFCGIVVVEVIEDVVRGEEPPLVPVARDIPVRRAAFIGKVSAHPVGEVGRLPYATPFSRVLADLRPRLVPVDADSVWLAADQARAQAISDSEVHSLIVAPLAVRGQALGLVSFYRADGEELFEEEDIDLTSDVCAHAALCIENARRYTQERTIARTLKRRLLPQRPASPSTVDIARLHIPGLGGGGAWFDVIELEGARTALIVGDVSGRGMATATTMGQLRTALHALAALDLEPDELMARLSDTAARLAEERAALPAGDPLHSEPLSAGCLIAVYDSVEQECTIVRAGLPKPLAVHPDGTAVSLPVSGSPPLAPPGSAPFPATTVRLPAGSTLAIANEEIDVKSTSVAELLGESASRPLGDLCDKIAYALLNPEDKEKLVLLARPEALPQKQILTRSLPVDPEAAPMARAEVRRQLEAWRIDEETAYTTELIASELVSNAVRYGAAPIRLRLIMDRLLTCEVSDTASSSPHVKHVRTIEETGRGLFIVSSVADNWGTRYNMEGKTVWAQQPVAER